MKARGATLLGAAATIAIVTAASRVVGFGRWVAQLSEIGPNALGTAYNSANAIPNVMFEVVAGGALASVVVPLLAGPVAKSLRGEVDRTASALLTWTLTALVPLGALVAVLAHPIVSLFLPGSPAGDVAVAADFLRVFSVQIPLYGVAVVLAGILQAHHRFLWPALAPLLSSVVVIGVYLAFGALVTGSKDAPAALPGSALALLAWGTTLGVVVLSLPLFAPVARAGLRLRPTWSFPPGVAARARALAMAGIGALLAQQASILVVMRMANESGGPGAYPMQQFLQALYLLPYAVLAYPLATATFPRFAELADAGDRDGFARLVAGTTRVVLVMAGVGAVALTAAAPALETASAAFADGDVSGAAEGLAAMAPGLVGLALILHLSRALYAAGRSRTAVLATASGWLTVAAVAPLAAAWLVPQPPDQPGTLLALGIANTLGMTVAGVGLVLGVGRTLGRSALAGLARTGAALAAGGIGGTVLGRLATDALDATSLAGALGAAVAGGVVGAGALLGVTLVADRGSWVRLRATLRSRPVE